MALYFFHPGPRPPNRSINAKHYAATPNNPRAKQWRVARGPNSIEHTVQLRRAVLFCSDLAHIDVLREYNDALREYNVARARKSARSHRQEV